MVDERKLGYYFKKYSESLQSVTYKRFGKYYHDNSYKPSEYIYLCPLCLKNKVGIVDAYIHYDEDFTLDHFPPKSVGGEQTVLVCKSCNSKSGIDFDYSLKEWLNSMGFIKNIPGAKIPIRLRFENTKGIYKGNLIMNNTKSWGLDEFGKYPLATEWFKKVLSGNSSTQTMTFKEVSIERVKKAIVKTAYLYCFSIWGYDFIYSETGLRLRNLMFENGTHPLSNMGIFFHMDNVYPPSGLTYVFKPTELQAFMISSKFKSKDIGFECGASVLIPGAGINCWQNIGE